jgi:PEP-CTERM motif
VRIRLTTCVVALLLLAVPAFAVADPITTITLQRLAATGAHVAVLGADVEGDDERDNANLLFIQNAAALELNAAVGTATLASALSNDSHRLTGSGATTATAQSPVAGDGTNAGASGFVSLLWEFRLDETHQFDFDGSFAASAVHFGSSNAGASWNMSLSGTPNGGPHATFFSHSGSAAEGTAERGLLTPGLYTFEFSSGSGSVADVGNGSGATNFAFTLDLSQAATPTPEPGTVLLLGSGLLTLVASRRRTIGPSR